MPTRAYYHAHVSYFLFIQKSHSLILKSNSRIFSWTFEPGMNYTYMIELFETVMNPNNALCQYEVEH